jgi:hypothetical protein
MRRAAALLGVAVAAAVVGPAVGPAQADAALTATGIRIGDHPGFVRVVVDFTGGRVLTGQVVASDHDPFGDGAVRLPLTRRGVRTTAAPRSAHGISARITQGRGRIVVRLTGAADRRFKYAGYHALRFPERLVIDLYESAPPGPAAEIRAAPDRCLTLDAFSAGARRVTARGSERDLFEHSLVVRLRRADGRIHRQRAVTAAAGSWRTRFRFPATRRRTGTLEAVALSAKDGTLECLVQVRVRFGG